MPEGGTLDGKKDEVAPPHRISRLKAANTTPVFVAPDDTIEKAVTLMLSHDFSQLPIMTTAHNVKGLVNWKSIGRRLALGRSCSHVRECSESHCELMSTASIFDAVQEVATHDCVLIRDETRKIVGIVTAYDISEQFGMLAEPFLLLGDIEGSLRVIIETAFTLEDLIATKDINDVEREINSAADLTFGEYRRLLENPAHWAKVGLSLDRKVFVEELEGVREIRNDIMHFDPDGIDDKQMDRLRRFNHLLEQIGEIKRS